MDSASLLTFVFSALTGYLSGSVPYGLLLAKGFCGIDPRLDGSRNIGATNIARLCGKKWGFFTLLCDALKGALPIITVLLWFSSSAISITTVTLYTLAAGAGAIIGHMFPLWLKFKGGKGVATTVGVFLVLAPLELIAAGILCLLVIWRTGFVSAGSLILSITLPALLFYTGKTSTACLAVIIGIGVFIAHRENIKRLWNGTEKHWNKKSS